MTPGLIDGAKITVAGAALFLLYILIFAIYNRKRTDKECYPEGDALLKEWKKQELREIRKSVEQDVETTLSAGAVRPERTEIPKLENGFVGGFKINLEDDKNSNL